MRRTYGASTSQHNFAYLIKNPNLHPSVREAFTREVEFRSVESGKAYSRNTLKSQTSFSMHSASSVDADKVALTTCLCFCSCTCFRSRY